MTMAVARGAFSGGSSPLASRLAVAAVHLFVIVLFLQNVHQDTWAAILGFLFIHVYSVMVLAFWSRLERTAAGDAAIVALTLEFVLIAVLFWDTFSLWPWSTFFGLALVQLCAFSAVRFWSQLRKAPPTAWFGLLVVLIYVMIAATAPIVAPYGETQVVGPEYEPWGGAFLLGTDNLGRDMFTRLIYGARNTVGVAFVTTCLAFLLGGFGGLLAAALRGWVDQALGRLVDVLMAIPSLIFALLILSIVGTSILSLVLVIGILDSTRVFRLSRAVAMNVVVMDFVEAANLRGEAGSSRMRAMCPIQAALTRS